MYIKEKNIDMYEIEQIVYHKDQMRLNFNWEEIDDELIKRVKDNVEGLELVIIDKPLEEIEEQPPKTVFLKTLDMLRERKGLSLKQLSQIYNEKFVFTLMV